MQASMPAARKGATLGSSSGEGCVCLQENRRFKAVVQTKTSRKVVGGCYAFFTAPAPPTHQTHPARHKIAKRPSVHFTASCWAGPACSLSCCCKCSHPACLACPADCFAGVFDTAEEAARAYDLESLRVIGRGAITNFPLSGRPGLLLITQHATRLCKGPGFKAALLAMRCQAATWGHTFCVGLRCVRRFVAKSTLQSSRGSLACVPPLTPARKAPQTSNPPCLSGRQRHW
jgi:hypothetical protein